MLSSLLFATVLAAVAVRADPNPLEPEPGTVYNEGSTCRISWGPDTSETWTTMDIELMCGDNSDMIYMTTVATVDGTDATKTSFEYPCPQVTPNSAIYFYQFTSPNTSDVTWTTRFAIADASGNTTPPANSTQPDDGGPIPWGIGTLVGPTTAVPEPSSGTGNSNGSTATAPPSGPASSGTSTAASESSGAATAPALAASSPSTAGPNTVLGLGGSSGSPTKSSLLTVTAGSTAPTNSASAKNTTGSGATNGVAVGVSVSSRITQAIATLVVVGAAFAVVL